MTCLELDMGAQMVVPPIAPEERATVLAILAEHDAIDLEPMLLGDEDDEDR